MYHLWVEAEIKEKGNVAINLKSLEQSSRIFGVHSDDEVLTPYQKAVNNASLELAKNDCAFLQNRGELFALARKKVDEDGYAYSKKTSWSSKFGKAATHAPKPKRKYLQSSMREENIKNVSSAIQSHQETIALLQKQKQKYSNAEKFLEAAEINKSILEITNQKQLKVKELAELSKAEARSNMVRKKKKVAKKNTNTSSVGLGTWLKRESSSYESGGDTDILDKSENETKSEAKKKPSGSEGCESSPLLGDSELLQQGKASAEIQDHRELKVQGQESSKNYFL